MASAAGAELLAVWGLFALVGLLARRDRRLLRRLPVAGLVVALGVGAAYLVITLAMQLFRRRVGDAAGTAFDPRVPHFLTILAGGFAIPTLLTWIRAYAKLDVPRWWRRVRTERAWTVACLALGLAGAGVYYTLGRLVVDRWNYSDEITLFESDGPLYVRFMNDTATAEYPVTHRHPLYVALARGLFRIAQVLVGAQCAPLLVNALFGGVGVALAAAYFRAVIGARGPALLLAATLGVSTAHLVFGAIPETYALSAAGLILLHWLLAKRSCGTVRLRHEVPAAVFAIGATTTHAFTAAVCFLTARPRRAWRRLLVGWAAAAVTVLAMCVTIQGVLIPATATYPDGGALGGEARYLRADSRGSLGGAVWNLGRGLLAENVVAPGVTVRLDADSRVGLRLGSYDHWLGRACVVVWWCGLAAAGGVILACRRTRRPTLYAALLCLAATALLHLFYGNAHVFLYSCTFTFYLFAAAAHALVVVPRRPACVLLAAFTLLLLSNNARFCAAWLQVLGEVVPTR